MSSSAHSSPGNSPARAKATVAPVPPAHAIRIGISGWQYKLWRGSFYPANLPQRAELQYASSVLTAIEINGSFYSLQLPKSYAK